MTKQELIEQRKLQLMAMNWTAESALAEAQRTYASYVEAETEVPDEVLNGVISPNPGPTDVQDGEDGGVVQQVVETAPAPVKRSHKASKEQG